MGSKADLPVCLYGSPPPFHHFNAMLVGVIAQLSLPDGSPKEGSSGVGGGTPTMHMEVDWDLGVSGHSDDLPQEEEVCVLCCMQINCKRSCTVANTPGST